MENYLIVLIKTFVSYFFLLILMKFMGKREIGQLSLFDLIILLTIADIMVFGIDNFERNVLYSFLPMILVAILQRIIAILCLKVAFFRKIFDGEESIIIVNGKIDYQVMKKQRYNMNDLYTELRQNEINNIKEVAYGILEANGKLSIYKKTKSKNSFPIPIILSGVVNKKALNVINKDEEWVKKELLKNNLTVKEVLIASYNDCNLEFITKNS